MLYYLLADSPVSLSHVNIKESQPPTLSIYGMVEFKDEKKVKQKSHEGKGKSAWIPRSQEAMLRALGDWLRVKCE